MRHKYVNIICIIIIIILLIFCYFKVRKVSLIKTYYKIPSYLVSIQITGTNLLFIHIPKNAGTYFAINYTNSKKSQGHHSIVTIPSHFRHLTVAIIRNPYDRFVSIYEYARMENSYYHNHGSHDHYKYASTHSFDEYVNAIYTGALKRDWHTNMTQTDMIEIDGKIPCFALLRFENLYFEIHTKLGLSVIIKKINVTSKKLDWRTYYTNINTIGIINKMFEKDFKNFEYQKLSSLCPATINNTH